jgi:hypothetical protein
LNITFKLRFTRLKSKMKEKAKQKRQESPSWISSVTSLFLVCNVAIFIYNAFISVNEATIPTTSSVDLETQIRYWELEKSSMEEQIQNLIEDLQIAASQPNFKSVATISTINTPKYKHEDLVCGIITTAKYHKNRAKSVHETWGKRCGVLLFFDATPSKDLPLIHLPGIISIQSQF